MANEPLIVKRIRNFSFVYDEATRRSINLWEREIKGYAERFLAKNASNPRQDHVKAMLETDVNYCAMRGVLLKIHQTAIPIGVQHD